MARLFRTAVLVALAARAIPAFRPGVSIRHFIARPALARRHLLGPIFSSADDSEDWPSDVESADTIAEAEVTTDSAAKANEVVTEVVNPVSSEERSALMASLPATATTDLDEASRIAVTELVLALEKLNGVASPATDPLLNGRWELLYSGGQAQSLLPSPTRQIALFLYAGGYSPGMFALKLATGFNLASVGGLTVTISRDQPRVEAEASVRLGSADTVAKLSCRLEAESPTRLRETYESIQVAGSDQAIPDPLQYSRTLYITYLDDELLITRDASGAVDILKRSDMVFAGSGGGSEGVPSSADDDLSPGAG